MLAIPRIDPSKVRTLTTGVDVRHRDIDLRTGVRLHVAETGPEDAPPLLAVHGWPQHWWMWRHVMQRLAASHRIISPDLRGFGWSGSPPDGDFTKASLAADLLALLDELGVHRAGYLGHDWGGWIGWLLALRAPERWTRLLLLGIPHPWPPRDATVRHAWRFAYQYPLAAPVLGPALVRDGRVVRALLRTGMDADTAAVYADVIRRPAQAAASSALYRQFQLRELPGLLAGRDMRGRIEPPVSLVVGHGDPVAHPALLAGLERHAPNSAVERVDGGHFLPDERPELVADRTAAWFA